MKKSSVHSIYNKDLFRQAGLDPESPPTNRAEMKEAIEKVTALGDDIYGFYFSGACMGCVAYIMVGTVWASGGDFLNADATEAYFDAPEFKAALEFYRWMWTNGHVTPSAEGDTGAGWDTLFKAGKFGMQGTNSVGLSTILRDHPDIDLGSFVMPGREGGKSVYIGGDCISIPAGSKHPDEAWEFIAWLSSEEAQVKNYMRLPRLTAPTPGHDISVLPCRCCAVPLPWCSLYK